MGVTGLTQQPPATGTLKPAAGDAEADDDAGAAMVGITSCNQSTTTLSAVIEN